MKKKLRIGIVIDQLLAGGVQFAAIEQVKQLNKMGHSAKLLILMRKKYPTDFSYLVRGIPHEYLSDSYPPLFRKTIRFPIFNFLSTLHLVSPVLAPRVVKAQEHDILVSWGTTTCLTTQAIFRKLKTPYIAIIPDPIVYILEKVYAQTTLRFFFPILKPLAKFFERSFVNDAVETIILSKVHSDYLKKNYDIEAKILHLGVSPQTRFPYKRGDALLSFGRWEKEKNPLFLLKLLKKMPKSKLIIAGSWTNKEDLNWFRGQIQRARLTKRVQIIPHYSNRQLKAICATARLWLHPHFEAFGLAALEAASYGLPIIIPASSGVTEKFTHGVHGFFPKTVDLKEYQKYVELLSSDERLAHKMGQAAARVVRKEYSWESNVHELLEIIKRNIDAKKKPEVLIIETGHSLGTALGGGDMFMEPMATRLADKYNFTVITSQIGAAHWNKASLTKAMEVLPENPFDNKGDPVPVFLSYCIRMWQTYFILKQEADTHFLIYSSTNVLPDILPAFFIKGKRPKLGWIARIHHLIPPPHKRKGRLIVNIVSFMMQYLALYMMKSRANIIIALNRSLKRDLEKRGFPKKKLRVLGGGIEFAGIASVKAQKKLTFDAVFVGRLHEAKGVFDTIPIWTQVTKKLPKAKLVLIGDGPVNLKKRLTREIEKANLSDNVKLLGFIPHPEVFSFLKPAKVFLFLDHEAGWGLAVAEAMACGLPVIGYKLPIFEHVYQKGFIAVQKYNTDALANKVVSLLTKPQQWKKFSRDAKKQAQNLSWDTTTEKFLTFLEEIESQLHS